MPLGDGTSLFGQPQPIPDDDEDAPVRLVTSEPAREPAEVAVGDVGPRKAGREEKGPPSTHRMNDVAALAFWQAFTEAKREDPYLSQREYLSQVVLAGLPSRYVPRKGNRKK